ncbi:MAG TPA: DJ-1/PfpI family protein [Polyangia bacterium]|jgi:transcriptional regulator GlxA family with amidase domain|nr:DJ-1/PfpI family protein [Polyangia bacterium]
MAQVIGIYAFDEVEVLDFAAPFEVFSTASRVHARTAGGAAPRFDVSLIADRPRTVRARGGFPVVCGRSIADHPPLDVLIVPGGVVTAELERPDVIAWIAAQARSAGIMASVCTGAFLLARAGLLDGRRVTTHWEDIADLRRMFPALKVEEGPRWIDEGPIVTSAGISAGIDMSLHLVGRLAGEELALRTARQMDYDWRRK